MVYAFAPSAAVSRPTTTTTTTTTTPATCRTRMSSHSPSPSPSPSPQTPHVHAQSRRAFLFAALSLAAAAGPGVAAAATGGKTSLTGDYTQDATAVLSDMRVACDLARGTPGMADTVARTRREMNDFVALYRRNEKVAGSPSFSTLYTAINTLSGHYASYGNAYPVPEKRKKRLNQQFTDIDRALNRGR